jgi:hypothetical protein
MMAKLSFTLVLVLLVTTASAQQTCPPEGPQVAVYFDEAGTVRYKDSPGPGVVDEVWIYGEGIPCAAVNGIQYAVDYGASLQWIEDVVTASVVMGESPTGIAMAFGAEPRPGSKFLIQSARVMWTDDCTVENVTGPTVLPHPDLEPLPAYSCIPSGFGFADGVRSQTCQNVQLDIKPGSCSNPFNIHAARGTRGRGGVLPVAILGSSTVDVSTIDVSTLLLEGVAALPTGQGLEDVASLDECEDEGRDRWLDLTAKFPTKGIASAIGTRQVDDVVPLTLTGCYMDGMPFSATDFVTVIVNRPTDGVVSTDGGDMLGFVSPNPFNPVTRIGYEVSKTQHVRIAAYDVAGRLVEELVNEVKGAGAYVVEWDAGKMPSGVYFLRLQTAGQTVVRRATLLK